MKRSICHPPSSLSSTPPPPSHHHPLPTTTPSHHHPPLFCSSAPPFPFLSVLSPSCMPLYTCSPCYPCNMHSRRQHGRGLVGEKGKENWEGTLATLYKKRAFCIMPTNFQVIVFHQLLITIIVFANQKLMCAFN